MRPFFTSADKEAPRPIEAIFCCAKLVMEGRPTAKASEPGVVLGAEQPRVWLSRQEAMALASVVSRAPSASVYRFRDLNPQHMREVYVPSKHQASGSWRTEYAEREFKEFLIGVFVRKGGKR